MDNSHAPLYVPPSCDAHLVLGYLANCIETNGQASREDWNNALYAAAQMKLVRPN